MHLSLSQLLDLRDMPFIRGMIVYIYALADSEGGEGDVRPPPKKPKNPK